MLKSKLFTHEKKSDIHYAVISKSTTIRGWLEDVTNELIMNDEDTYHSIYQTAKKACVTQTKEAELARYAIGEEKVIFPLPPNLSIEDIAKELEDNVIEITLGDEDPSFDGCRLKLKPFYVYKSCGVEDSSALNSLAMPLGAVSLSFTVNAIEVPILGGFKIELDASPRPKCSIS